MYLDVIHIKWGNFQIVVSHMSTTLYFPFDHANSIAMLYILHKYKKKFESTNMVISNFYKVF